MGIGPGNLDELSLRARQALEGAEVVVGYHTYLRLIAPLIAGKDIRGSGMRKEMERCRLAVTEAAAGRDVVLVSSGDPGVYGMAGPLLEALDESPVAQGVEVEVVPGITAATAAAAVLGAPLVHDFAVISLSDLLTPWPTITCRIEMAGRADFVVVFYNPMSSRRVRQLAEARDILLGFRDPETPAGIVRQAGRPEEASVITTLAALGEEPLDMSCTVIVGNSQTRIIRGKLCTPRGYVW